MKSNKRNNKGISLIVLVITIIIMIILAGAIILSLSGTGLITNANKGSFQSDIATMQEELGVYIANKITETKGKYTQDTLFASEDNLEENGAKVEGKNIKSVLTSIDKKYIDEVEIINGKIVYVGDDLNKLKWASEVLLGIKKDIKESTSETQNITLEESANLNLINYRVYGNSQVGESGVTQNLGDYVLEFDNIWLQGQIYGNESYYNTRVRSANYVKSKAGVTYTITAELPYNMQLVVYNGTFTTYPFNIDRVVYDSGWKNNDITFTSEIDGNITMSIRYKNNSNISPESVKDCKVKIKAENEDVSYKYGIELKVTGKNLINVDAGLNDYLVKNQDGTYTITKKETGRFSAMIPIYIPANTSIAKSIEIVDKKITADDPADAYTVVAAMITFSDGTTTGSPFYPNTSGSSTGNYHVSKYDKDIVGIKLYMLPEWHNGSYITFKNMQLEIGTEWTEYESYINDKYNIYLDEPLRKVGEYVDYIDFRKQEIVRNVEEVDGELRGLSTPKVKKISLPSILLTEGRNNISILTDVSPSKIYMMYYTK